MRWGYGLVMLAAGIGIGTACGGISTAAPAAPATATEAAAPLNPAALATLKMLDERKASLHDFTAKVDYSVQHITGDEDGSRGTIDYVDDGAAGAKFSIDFTMDTVSGKPTHLHHKQVICDGKNITTIDFQAKQFTRSPGVATNSLSSAIPLPIGNAPAAVAADFAVKVMPNADANQTTLRLTPRVKGKFDYQQLDITVDKTLRLPVKIVAYSNRGEVTTLRFIFGDKPEINTGKAKVASAAVPSGADWSVHITPAASAAGAAPAPSARP